MAFDPELLARSFAFEAEQVGALRAQWLALLDLCVWGELKSQTIGALPKLRKRMLELGENLRSVVGDRRWIPQERERIKGAMAASLNLRDALLQLERAAKPIDGGTDFPRFEQDILRLRHELLVFMEKHEGMWGDLLESQYAEDEDEDEDEDD